MEIEIKNRWNGNVIISGEYEDIKDALQKNSGVDLRGANFNGVNLSRVDLSEANLYGATLIGANLSWANFIGANLSWANLTGAELDGVKGITLPIINIIGSSYHFFYMNGIIKIGCEHWPVEYWIEHYEEMGHKNNFTDSNKLQNMAGILKW